MGPWNGKSSVVGGQTGKNPLWGRYGYFLEPHIARYRVLILTVFFFLKNLVDTATNISPEDTLPTSRMHITELICDMKIIDLIR